MSIFLALAGGALIGWGLGEPKKIDMKFIMAGGLIWFGALITIFV